MKIFHCTYPNGKKLMRHNLEMISEGIKTSYHVDYLVICKYCSDYTECYPFKIKRSNSEHMENSKMKI